MRHNYRWENIASKSLDAVMLPQATKRKPSFSLLANLNSAQKTDFS